MKPAAAARSTARIVACPTCRGPSRYAQDNPFRPFCSERCRAIDLGGWADERYRVGTQPGDERDDESPNAPPTAH
jgi:endogenous inhibitor of DNA gyrase (YacG/DUF329 family)